MPLYVCSKCGTVENTALGGYWEQGYRAREAGEEHEPLCSQCDPSIGKWHAQFERAGADGYLADARGFLWTAEETTKVPHLGPFKAIAPRPASSD